VSTTPDPLTVLMSDAPRAVRLAYHITRDREAALDLSQEAFARAVQSADMLRDVGAARGWFNRILVNLCRDWLRRKGRERMALRQWQPEATAAPEWDPGMPEQLRRVRQALMALPQDYREAVAMVHVEGIAPRDAAEALGLPDGTLRWRVHEGLRQMREQLQAENEGVRHG